MAVLFYLFLLVGFAFTLQMVINDIKNTGTVQRNIIIAFVFNCVIGFPLLAVEIFKVLKNSKE